MTEKGGKAVAEVTLMSELCEIFNLPTMSRMLRLMPLALRVASLGLALVLASCSGTSELLQPYASEAQASV